jgi:uncharacterized membrane protein
MDPQAPSPQSTAQVPWTPQQPSGPGGFDLREFVAFRYLITPTIITIVYVIGAVVITIAGLGAIASGGGGLLGGLVILLFGNLYWRVILEFVVVLFRMNDALQSIDRRGKGM